MSNTGKSPTSIVLGRTNVPYLSPAQKYFIPFTEPLPVPKGSSNNTPTQQPWPRSITFPTKRIQPLAPDSNLHLDPTWKVDASSPKYQGSYSSGEDAALFMWMMLGFSYRNFFFHFLKLSGSLSQSSSDIMYFSTPSQLQISFKMELGLESITQMIIPVQAPQQPSGLLSSYISAIKLFLTSLSCKRIQATTDPYLASIFSLTARMV